MKAVSSSSWQRRRPQFDASTFTQAEQLRHQLLAAVPSIEAFNFDHHSYLGISIPALRAIDANVSGQITVPQATDTSYCAQIMDGQIRWSERGPGGAPLPHPCS